MGRRAFSLIELIAVLSIAGVMLSLLLLGVQAARSSARKFQCQNSIRQCGLALANAESANKKYPAFENGYYRPKRLGEYSLYSVHNELLPYLECTKIPYEDLGFADDLGPVFPYSDRCPTFSCPDENVSTGTSYRVNIGTGVNATPSVKTPQNGNGAFVALRQLTSRDFADGISLTVAFSERTKGKGPSKSDQFHPHLYVPHGGMTIDEILQITFSSDSLQYPSAGWSIRAGSMRHTGYTHAVLPNSDTDDVLFCSSLSVYVNSCWAGLIPARSHHNGGVHVTMMDCSVHFIANTVDISVWQAIATRASHETVTLSN